MATVTLVANTAYSALTVADGDTIELAGYTLDMDVVPTEINVIVQTPGTAGKMTLVTGYTYPLTGWTMTAGTGVLIATVPTGTTLGGELIGGSASGAYGCHTNHGTITDCTGGSASGASGCFFHYGTITTCTAGSAGNAFGCSYNYGTITDCTSGSVSNTYGCVYNYGTITDCTGGSVSSTYGCGFNYGTITTCTAGSASSAYGCINNYGTITTSTGGSASGSHGCDINYGTITDCTGGSVSGAYGCRLKYGATLNITDNTGLAVNTWYGSVAFMIGDGIRGTVKSAITNLYTLGEPHASATIDPGTTVTVLSEGTGLTLHPLASQVTHPIGLS
jgi:hypothetical protein